MMRLLAKTLVGLALLAPTAAAAADASAVWAAEDAYWRAVTSRDAGAFDRLFDSRFVGWSCDAPNAAGNPVAPRPDGARYAFAMEHKMAVLGPDVAVTYFTGRMRAERPGRPLEQKVRDYTHTWVRSGGGWKILGGMCRETGHAGG